jgi:hypothetical protein
LKAGDCPFSQTPGFSRSLKNSQFPVRSRKSCLTQNQGYVIQEDQKAGRVDELDLLFINPHGWCCWMLAKALSHSIQYHLLTVVMPLFIYQTLALMELFVYAQSWRHGASLGAGRGLLSALG